MKCYQCGEEAINENQLCAIDQEKKERRDALKEKYDVVSVEGTGKTYTLVKGTLIPYTWQIKKDAFDSLPKEVISGELVGDIIIRQP